MKDLIENEITQDVQKKIIQELNDSENKGEAILLAIQEVVDNKTIKIIEKLKEEEKEFVANKKTAEQLGLKTVFSKEEKEFYEKFKQSSGVTFTQPSVIPTSIINVALDEMQTESKLLNIAEILPADVKEWIVSDYNCLYSWHSISDELKEEIKATIKGTQFDINELDCYLIVPKALSELSLPFVDKFFNSIVKESLIKGAEYGMLNGNGNEEPIGYYYQIDKSIDGVHSLKEIDNSINNFSPETMGKIENYLSKEGKRNVEKIFLVCNPSDKAMYVKRAMYKEDGTKIPAAEEIEVITSTENPKGKALFTLEKKYKLGFSGYSIKKYDQTLALKNADLLVGTVKANGRATSDNDAYVFDVTKLEKYVEKVKVINLENESLAEGETV